MRDFGLFAIIGLLLVASYGLLSRIETVNPQSASETPPVANLIMRDFTATTFSPQGIPAQRLEARVMTHYPDRDAELDRPHLRRMENGRELWQAWSEHATISPDGNTIHLLGAARLREEGSDNALRVETRDLRVNVPANFAETEAPAVIHHAAGRTEARGMTVWLESRRAELHAQVEGHYHTEPTSP